MTRRKYVREWLMSISGRHRNQWFENADGEFYLRRSQRLTHDLHTIVITLDLANVSIRKRGQGIWTEYLKLFEEEAPKFGFQAVFLENVDSSNAGLQAFYERKGYNKRAFESLCYVKYLKQEQPT